MSDYRTAVDSIRDSDLDRIAANLPPLCVEDMLARVEESLKNAFSFITDPYSLLRYYQFLIKKEQVPIKREMPLLSPIRGIDDASLQWSKNLVFLREGGSPSELLSTSKSVVDTVLSLASIAESRAPIDPTQLLARVGVSPYVDALVSHIFRTRKRPEDRDAVRIHLDSVSFKDDVLAFLLDLSAESRLEILAPSEMGTYLEAGKLGERNLCALLRYIGERQESSLLEALHDLVGQPYVTAPVLYSLVDVIGQLGDPKSLATLRTLSKGASPTLSEFIQTSVEEIEVRTNTAQEAMPGGVTIVQCSFYGDLTKPGVSSGGGLSTFLFELGNHLADQDTVSEVFTLNLLSVHDDSSEPLVLKLQDNHTLIRVPVTFEIVDESHDFLQNEFEILRAIRRTLERHNINPDILHIRYTDNASRAVLKLAKQLDKRVVFTLTPDPHATLVDGEGNYRSMDEAELLRNLNKVFIADRLVDQVDGLLLIGYEGKNTQVLPFFPQLIFDSQTREKPLTIVAEGVCFESCQIDGTDIDAPLEMLTSHSGRFHIDKSLLKQPVILNVGRLHPLKGQQHLVKAWTESSLSEYYNLVLIGGNLADPNPIEQSVIEKIEDVIARNPDLVGRFSHFPALSNQEVRVLEQSIISSIHGTHPNVYLSSSYKEEFGISILEGMTAGFLVLAPQRGGVSDYIEDGVNGFLVATDDAESIRRGMEAILQNPETTESLHEVALRGQQLAQQRLSIKHIGRDYLKHYMELMQR